MLGGRGGTALVLTEGEDEAKRLIEGLRALDSMQQDRACRGRESPKWTDRTGMVLIVNAREI